MTERARDRITIAADFSRYPAGRFKADGPYSGERFRQEYLVPSLAKLDKVTVILDGTLGYGSSFLEEAFGGLVREEGFTATELKKKLVIVSKDDATFETEVWTYIEDAKADEK
jgi:hypothetical protein